MATKAEIHERFIKPLEQVLGEPRWKGADPEAVYDALMADLTWFSVAVLDAAVVEMRKTRRMFPSVSECLGACREAAGNAAAPRGEVVRFPKPETDAWNARLAAIRLVRSSGALARRADDEGWLYVLVEFAGDNECLPSGREIEELKATARRHEDKAHAVGSDLRNSVFQLLTNMRARASREVFRESSTSRAA